VYPRWRRHIKKCFTLGRASDLTRIKPDWKGLLGTKTNT
jgi:hypothetical protein